MLAAIRPRTVPSQPMRCFRFFSCASSSVAVAGKIAGNARNSPPIPGPNRCASKPANTVADPPNRKRIKYSCGLVPFTAESLTSITQPLPPKIAHSPSATPSQTGIKTEAAASALILQRRNTKLAAAA